jgi:hypothetical protein
MLSFTSTPKADGSGAVSEHSLFSVLCDLRGISLRPWRLKALKALDREARKGIAKVAKKINVPLTLDASELELPCPAAIIRV